MANAIWPAISTFPTGMRPPCPAGPITPRVCAFKLSASGTRVPRIAGSSPNARAVAIDVANVTLTTRQSGLTSMPVTAPPRMRNVSSAVLPQYASASPSTPPTEANSRLSVSSWRISRPRPAPMDRRIAISRPRLIARARSRLAMFAHAMASSSPTISSRTMSGVANSDRMGEKPPDAGSNVTGAGSRVLATWRILGQSHGFGGRRRASGRHPDHDSQPRELRLGRPRLLKIAARALVSSPQTGAPPASLLVPIRRASGYQRSHQRTREPQRRRWPCVRR